MSGSAAFAQSGMSEIDGEIATGMVTLSIVSHAQRRLVEGLIEDLSTLSSKAVSHLILTLNLPEAEPAGLDRIRAKVSVLHNLRPQGFAANHNRAFELCDSPVFAALNPDLRLLQDPFPSLLRALAAPSTGLVTPVILSADGTPAPFARQLYTPLEVVSRRLRRIGSASAQPAWVAGTFMTIRSHAFREVSGFNEQFRLYVEDVDLCARLRLAGWRLAVVPDAQVVHDAQYTSHRSLQHLYWHVGSMLKFWRSPTFWRYRAMLKEEHGRKRTASRQ